jgi:tetratricopeptide (TPR) repeat protein
MLAEALAAHNAAHRAAERIRLRMALHAGEVSYDAHGVTASSINHAFRLLDAPQLKAALAGSPGVLALVASAWFFDEVVRNSGGCDPSNYYPVQVTVKETSTTAWISLPDQPATNRVTDFVPEGTRPILPRQLPSRAPHFIGRIPELRRLTHLLDATTKDGGTVVISAINGTAGIGKSALAVHWAHQMRDRFPDGQLYVNLRGYDSGSPVTPEQALDGFLRALDVSGNKLPRTVDLMSAKYRSLLTERRMLVVLDNAASSDQVRPLLSASPTCMVLVTSRNRLSGLVARDGAYRLTLDLLSPQEAVALLRTIIGAARVDREPDAIAELTRRCAYLPLALRIAAERVAARPHLDVADLVQDLAGERDRLDILTVDDDESTTVRAVFSWSYRSLPVETARVFRLLGLHPGPDISVPAAAILTGTGAVAVGRQLERLAAVHLIEETGRNRYAFHDLLRSYAAERAATGESKNERDNARWRTFQWYLHTAHAASNALYPHQPTRPIEPPAIGDNPMSFASREEALRWYDLEQANLMAVVTEAAAADWHTIVWQLPTVLHTYLRLRSRWADRIAVNQLGLAAARHLQDRRAEYWALVGIAETYIEMERFTEAITSYAEPALTIAQAIGDQRAEAFVLHDLGRAYHGLRQYGRAIEQLDQALAIYQAIRDRRGEGIVLSLIGDSYRGDHQLDQALSYAQQGLVVLRTIDSQWDQARALRRLGLTYQDLGNLDEAIKHFQLAITIYRNLDHPYEAAKTLHNLGEAQYNAGHPDQAHTSWHEALTILDELNPSEATTLRTRLTATHPQEPQQLH